MRARQNYAMCLFRWPFHKITFVHLRFTTRPPSKCPLPLVKTKFYDIVLSLWKNFLFSLSNEQYLLQTFPGNQDKTLTNILFYFFIFYNISSSNQKIFATLNKLISFHPLHDSYEHESFNTRVPSEIRDKKREEYFLAFIRRALPL